MSHNVYYVHSDKTLRPYRLILAEHFQELLKEQGITCGMSRAGEVWDNPAMESFVSSLKTERTARKVYRTREQARAGMPNCQKKTCHLATTAGSFRVENFYNGDHDRSLAYCFTDDVLIGM